MKKRINITLDELTVERLNVIRDHHTAFNLSKFIEESIKKSLGPLTPTEEIAVEAYKRRNNERKP